MLKVSLVKLQIPKCWYNGTILPFAFWNSVSGKRHGNSWKCHIPPFNDFRVFRVLGFLDFRKSVKKNTDIRKNNQGKKNANRPLRPYLEIYQEGRENILFCDIWRGKYIILTFSLSDGTGRIALLHRDLPAVQYPKAAHNVYYCIIAAHPII
jgi:hypothetical protein